VETISETDTKINQEMHSFGWDTSQIFPALKIATAPLSGAKDDLKKARRGVMRLIERIENASLREIDEFLDRLTDLAKEDITFEEARHISRELDSLGEIGQLLSAIERDINNFNEDQRRILLVESFNENIKRLDRLHSQIAFEALKNEDEFRFEYLLLVQTILLKLLQATKTALETLEKRSKLDSTVNGALVATFYGLIRIEAFRRGKITIGDLHDTLTLLVDIIRSPEPVLRIESPALCKG